MEEQSSRRSSRKRNRSLTVEIGESEVSSLKEDDSSSARRSSRRRSSPLSEADSVYSNYGWKDIASTNGTQQHASVVNGHRSSSRQRENSPKDGIENITNYTEKSIGLQNTARDAQGNQKNAKKKPDQPMTINACASLLASLDKRAYHRRLLSDANGILKDILIPSSLPWMHNVPPVARNIPCDIDEMTDILIADDGSFSPYDNGPFGFGRFDTGQWRRRPSNNRLGTSADTWCAASRRSSDPGVVNLSSVLLPLYPPKTHKMPGAGVVARKRNRHAEESNGETLGGSKIDTGELSLRLSEADLRSKRNRLKEIQSTASKLKISVRVNSSSSRSTIFSGLVMDETSPFGKILEAVLPIEVQEGRFLRVTRAKEIAEGLGTYDWRYGLAPSNKTGKNANRRGCGRTRVIWTTKHPSDQPQRVTYSSLLTGARIENGSQRRPREVKVVIRVGGEIIGSKSGVVEETGDLAIKKAKKSGRENFSGILDGELKAASFQTRRDNDQVLSSSHTMPTLVCLPDSDGRGKVVCEDPGEIPFSSVHHILNTAAKMKSQCCIVCWSASSVRGSEVVACSKCGVFVHPRCIRDTTSENNNRWKCGVCTSHQTDPPCVEPFVESSSPPSKKNKRKSKPPPWLEDSHVPDPLPAHRAARVRHGCGPQFVKCALCPFSGGAMSRVSIRAQPVWVHEICRIWCGYPSRSMLAKPFGETPLYTTCVLCGFDESKQKAPYEKKRYLCGDSPSFSNLTECAEPGCHIRFHPMCATVAVHAFDDISRVSEANGGSVSPEVAKVETISTVTTDSQSKSNPSHFLLTMSKTADGLKEKSIPTTGILVKGGVPLGFCPVHNPENR